MTKIPVFYSEKQVAPAQGYSPSAAKPVAVVAEWERLALPIDVRGFTPATLAALTRAHDPDYVRAVLACREDNGFGTRDPKVAASLPYTSGSMLAAAREALANKRVAVSPTSGFHHAGYDGGAGFCTFNGLMVTALALLDEGVGKVAILDCDQHYGDGTDEILRGLPDALAVRVPHHTIGRHGYRPGDADKCFQRIVASIHGWKKQGVGVVLYQAGADPHVNDPLGGFLTTDELRERDAVVFDLCRALGLPVAWNLAGGYQRDAEGTIQPVLDVHTNTMRECVRVYGGA